MNSAYCINERATEHCAQMTLSNLVSLGRHQILCKSNINSQHLVKPSRIQRRINVDRVSIYGHLASIQPVLRIGSKAGNKAGVECKTGNRSASGVPLNADSYSRYCLCVTTSRLGKYRTTSSSEVEHRGRELEQWDKPLCASVPALHGSMGSDKRDKHDSFHGVSLCPDTGYGFIYLGT